MVSNLVERSFISKIEALIALRESIRKNEIEIKKGEKGRNVLFSSTPHTYRSINSPSRFRSIDDAEMFFPVGG